MEQIFYYDHFFNDVFFLNLFKFDKNNRKKNYNFSKINDNSTRTFHIEKYFAELFKFYKIENHKITLNEKKNNKFHKIVS